MFHRFVFDGINRHRRDNAVRQIVERTVSINVCLTKAALTVTDLAAPQTQVATRGAVIQLFLQAGFDQLILWCFATHGYRLIISRPKSPTCSCVAALVITAVLALSACR